MLRLFGPTRVSEGSGPRLPRAAFLAVALLDLAPSRVMTRETLAAKLWEGAPAVRASASLRQLVSRFYGAEVKPCQLHWTEVDRLIIEIWRQDIRRDADHH